MVALSFKPSMYQQAIFDAVIDRQNNIYVGAVAGSGKTTTLVEGMKLARQTDNVLFCAFNKHIKDTLAARAPSNTTVCTLNSLGNRTLIKHLPSRPRFDENKLWGIVKEVLPVDLRGLLVPLVKMAVLAKATLLDVTDANAVGQMVEYYGLDVNDDLPNMTKYLSIILEMCLARTSVIDFDDQIWMPVMLGYKPDQFDYVFVDECQDLNKAQIELVLSAVGSRAVAVGDRWQSIYGFRGADIYAVDNLVEALDAKELPLSICYRCPKSHVALAKQIVPQIEHSEFAEEGIIKHISYDETCKLLSDRDLVLCRVNAPLVQLCYKLIRDGRKAVIRGRDIGAGIITFIDKLKATNIIELLDNMKKYEDVEIVKLSVLRQNTRIAALQDKCDTLEALCDGMQSIDDLKSRIINIFDDTTKYGVICSSIHRAKGDEAERVIILHEEMMPHRLAKLPWQMDQERNLIYVSRTRAKKELIYVK